MKLMVASLVGMMALSGAAYAQSANDATGFIEGVAQSAFGNVTSQSFGLEGGIAIAPKIDIVVDLGMVRDSSPTSLGTVAQVVAAGLSNVQSAAVSYSVKQPIGFGMLGVRYTIPRSDKLHPYVEATGGMARLKRDVRFTIGGTDVTDNLSKYNAVLGSDLAGTQTKLMFGGGVGVVYDITPSFMFDAGYRFNRIASDPEATTVNRIGAGIGYRF
jgi:opacity protein-like surface antigen